jgi:phage shock protein B
MQGPEILIPLIVVPILFIGLPWLIFHYITKWKSNATMTREDENLMDELHDLARRLDERMCTVERIMAADNPNWRSIACDPVDTALEDRTAAAVPARRARSNQPERRV